MICFLNTSAKRETLLVVEGYRNYVVPAIIAGISLGERHCSGPASIRDEMSTPTCKAVVAIRNNPYICALHRQQSVVRGKQRTNGAQRLLGYVQKQSGFYYYI